MIDRRSFLKQLGAAAAATATLPYLSRIAYAGPMGLPIGIQLYSVRDSLKKDPAATLNQLHAIGYQEVETAGFAGKTAAEFRKLLEAASLRCPSAHLPLGGPDPAASFADAVTLGAAYATSGSLIQLRSPTPAPGSASSTAAASSGPTLDDFKRLAAKMNDLGRGAQKSGLRYAYHNHNVELTRMPDGSFGYDTLLHETDPKLVYFEIDCGWFVLGGADPVHYLQTYPKRIRMLHIKDFKQMSRPTTSTDSPDRPEGVELGKGFINYKRIFAAGKAAGVQHAFAEQEGPYAHSELDSAAANYKFLQSFS